MNDTVEPTPAEPADGPPPPETSTDVPIHSDETEFPAPENNEETEG